MIFLTRKRKAVYVPQTPAPKGFRCRSDDVTIWVWIYQLPFRKTQAEAEQDLAVLAASIPLVRQS